MRQRIEADQQSPFWCFAEVEPPSLDPAVDRAHADAPYKGCILRPEHLDLRGALGAPGKPLALIPPRPPGLFDEQRAFDLDLDLGSSLHLYVTCCRGRCVLCCCGDARLICPYLMPVLESRLTLGQ
jgi:hypothetical protein